MSAPKLLIANRGEIAVRIIRACRALGISPVAVYSEPDRDALHVRMADWAVPIGPAPAKESYLVVDKLLDAAAWTGATNTTLNLTNVQPNQIGYYSVGVSNAVTGVVSANAALHVSGYDFSQWQGLVAYYPFNGNANDVQNQMQF